MRFCFARSTRVLSLVLLSLSAVCSSAATNFTRAFNGRYQITNAVEQGTEVELTLTLSLVNSSKTAVKGGIVAVLSSDPIPVLIGSFSPIASLPALSRVVISQRLTLSATEYQRWQSGSAPRLQFLVGSGSGAIAVDIAAYHWLPPGSKAN